MPFITETLWRRLPGRDPQATIVVAAWPKPDHRANDPRALAEFGAGQEVIAAIRSIRAEYDVPPGQAIRATVSRPGPATQAAIRQLAVTIQRMAKVSDLTVIGEEGGSGGPTAGAALTDGAGLTIPLGDLIDTEKECRRLATEVDRLLRAIGGQEKKLANDQFVSRAPAEVVQKERDKLASWREQVAVLEGKRERLGCGR
jgi:valyl-tRNA synthetase